MLSRSSTNRKRSQSAALSSITNVHHQNNNNKRAKLEPNQNISSTNHKRTNVALTSITNVHHNNKRTKLCNESQQVNVNSQLFNRSTVNRALHLHHLPFDCLSSILSRISLHHRITRLSLVCHHWKSTVDQMCHLKGSLTINLFGNYKPRVMQLVTSDLEKYWENVRNEKMESLLLKPKNGKFSPSDLSVRFPLVTQLVIRSNDTTERQNRASLQLFLSLFGHQSQEWCSSLTSLTLYKMTKITDPTFLPQLFSVINHKFSQPSNLTQLYLYIQAFGPETAQCHPERVSLHNVLPQLERFFAHCCFPNWKSVLCSLGCAADTNTTIGCPRKCRVKELDLCQNRISLKNLSNLLSLTMFTSTVTHLHLTAILYRAWFSLICDSFGLLQFLQINLAYNKFDADWFNDLRKLSNLTELKMHRFQLDPTVNTVPLPKIKKLTICGYELLTKFQVATGSNRFNADFYCRLLSHHFPSVSVLILMSNEKRVKVAERNIRKWAQVHFKQIQKVILVLNSVEYRNHSRAGDKFMRQYYKSLQN